MKILTGYEAAALFAMRRRPTGVSHMGPFTEHLRGRSTASTTVQLSSASIARSTLGKSRPAPCLERQESHDGRDHRWLGKSGDDPSGSMELARQSIRGIRLWLWILVRDRVHAPCAHGVAHENSCSKRNAGRLPEALGGLCVLATLQTADRMRRGGQELVEI
eukprot:jgi/Botrbrau1/20562/Bobra.145_2s0109.1